MSKVGRLPIKIPEKVTVKLDKGEILVEGTLGKLKKKVPRKIKVKSKEGKIFVTRTGDDKEAKSLHGLTRTLIFNMVQGVSQGFKRVLELHGTGYRAKLEGENLVLALGFSHPVKVTPPSGIKFTLRGNEIIISGIDKQLVGQTAAHIRSLRKPEVYKGKGIRWQGEVVKLKPGKAAKLGEAGQE